MRWNFEGAGAALRSPFPWVALSAALALTAAGWFGIERSREEESRAQFDRRTETAMAALRTHMLAYEQVLLSGAARLASSPAVSPEDWRGFIVHLRLAERFPAIQAIGFAKRVRGPDRHAHPGAGIPDHEMRHAGEHDEMAVVILEEQVAAREPPFLGIDLYADPARRAAMRTASTTGEAAIAAQAARAAGAPARFAMFVPVFRDEGGRGRALAGFVFSPLHVPDLMRHVFEDDALQVIDLRIEDRTGGGRAVELVDTRAARGAAALPAPRFERQARFVTPGRDWSIHFASRPESDAALQGSRPWGALGAGLFASAVAFMLMVALVEAWNRAHELSMRDPLTGLYNRRYVDETMARELPRARRLAQSIGFVVMDLDHFKRLNDTFGHEAGDRVLVRFGELLRASTRGSDIAYRLGGEEFGVILPGATLEAASRRAEAVRAAFANMHLDFEGAPMGTLTVSAGVAALGPDRQDWGEALRRADRALYAAKQAGRNRVVALARESGPDSR